jgi:spermidine synthase
LVVIHFLCWIRILLFQAVVDVAKRFLPDLAVGYSDPRTELVVQDIATYVKAAV